MTNSRLSLSPIELLEGICTEWDSRHDDTVTFRSDISDLRGAAILAHTNRSARTAKALLSLIDQNCGVEIMPLVRVILEDAITVGWLLMDKNSAQIFVREGAKKRKTILNAIGDSPDSEGYKQALKLLDELDGVKVSTIEQRASTFKGGEVIYGHYRLASYLTHSGVGVSDRFAESVADGPGIVFLRSSRFSEAELWVRVAATSLLHSLCATDLAMRKPWRTTQLKKLCAKADMDVAVRYPDGRELPAR